MSRVIPLHRLVTSAAAAVAATAVAFALAGCVATGPSPDESIPPALLASDLDILEASADDGVDGFSVNISVAFTVERDDLSADDLREILRIVVENTHISNVNAIALIGHSDEIDPASVVDGTVYLDLVPAAVELGFDDPDDGLGTIRVDWDETVTMLERAG